jgi:hypothetical protein
VIEIRIVLIGLQSIDRDTKTDLRIHLPTVFGRVFGFLLWDQTLPNRKRAKLFDQRHVSTVTHVVLAIHNSAA